MLRGKGNKNIQRIHKHNFFLRIFQLFTNYRCLKINITTGKHDYTKGEQLQLGLFSEKLKQFKITVSTRLKSFPIERYSFMEMFLKGISLLFLNNVVSEFHIAFFSCYT